LTVLRKLDLPDSQASRHPDGRLIAASAERNIEAILDVLDRNAPKRGRALELASGTGQHIARFAAAMPDMEWLPSDADAGRFDSIEAWRHHRAAANLLSPLHFDATALPWPGQLGHFNLIVLINLLHLISEAETENLLRGVSTALRPGGTFLLYGPFRRAGVLTSPGDAAFHAHLQAQDPDIGYKDDVWVRTRAAEHGLGVWQVAKMPANNIAFVFRTAALAVNSREVVHPERG
jgi:SAM-dependent methyltransferase